VITRSAFAEWLVAYERLWRTAGTDSLGELFAADATYSMGPYEPTARGLDAIAAVWDEERPEGERFTMAASIVAVDGDAGVASIEVHYSAPIVREYRDVWIVRFGDDGRAVSFAEWPFWPAGQED
jgi:hypothetical protein